MNKTFRYIARSFRRFDISPLAPGGLSKEAVILFWGMNAVFFLASGLIHQPYDLKSSDSYVSCTVTKKLSKIDLYTEDIQIVSTPEYIIISSCNSDLPEYDVVITPSGRSPPIEV